jgi:hypothetical protein
MAVLHHVVAFKTICPAVESAGHLVLRTIARNTKAFDPRFLGKCDTHKALATVCVVTWRPGILIAQDAIVDVLEAVYT